MTTTLVNMVHKPLHTPTIDVRSLNLKLGGIQLLSDISVQSHTSGVTMVMGANGAGKSLFLRCLHRLLPVSSGSIRLQGKSVNDPILKQAMVFQKPTLLRRSVLQNLEFAAPDGTHQSEIERLLARVNLLGCKSQPARLLSGGEQQRLTLARALLIQPELLLLDESTASLDPASVVIFEEIIREAEREGVKSIFVSHDIGQAKRLASDVIFLHKGRVVEHTEATEFFNAPRSREAQAYLAGEILL